MHYDPEIEAAYEAERKLDLVTIDMTDYTKQQWFDEMCDYLTNVMSMNKKQVKAEFDKRFPELLNRDLGL